MRDLAKVLIKGYGNGSLPGGFCARHFAIEKDEWGWMSTPHSALGLLGRMRDRVIFNLNLEDVGWRFGRTRGGLGASAISGWVKTDRGRRLWGFDAHHLQ